MTQNAKKLSLLLMAMVLLCAGLQAADTDTTAREKNLYFTLKYGQGGFSDSRSDIGKLGGGQLAICAQHINIPLAISLSVEYYTNSSDPVDPYEISGMYSMNAFYSKYFFKKKRLQVFAGPGLGFMDVPQSPDESARSMLFDVAAGVNSRLLWRFGLYATYKYLYANKAGLVDFSEHILMLGISFNLDL